MFTLNWTVSAPALKPCIPDRTSVHTRADKGWAFKGTVSRQSSSFCLILPITRPQSLWNLKQVKKSHVNDKIRDLRQTNMSPEHYC